MVKNNNDFMPHDVNLYLKFAGITALGMLTLFLLAKTINEAKSYNTIGDSTADVARTITVSGHGEIEAKPNLATFSWTVNEDGKTVQESQSAANSKNNAALSYLKQH